MDIDRWVEEHREEIIQTAQELLWIKSVKTEPAPGQPFGAGVDEALRYILAKAGELGFKTKNLDGYAGHAEFGQGEELVGILNHVDVVPEGEDWTYPPYGAEIHDGRIYARGAIDDKGPAVAALFAMKAVKDLAGPLARRVRLIIGGDEESGWECMDHYFAHEEQPTFGFSPDADFPIVHAEKGILDVKLHCDFPDERLLEFRGGNRPNMVPDRARAVLQVPAGEAARYGEALAGAGSDARFSVEALGGDRLQVTVKGVSAHGSTPDKGINAVAALAKALAGLDLFSGGREGALLRALVRFAETTGRGLDIAGADEPSGALTANLGVAELTGGRLTAIINIRYPVTWEKSEILRHAARQAELAGYELAEVGGKPPLYVPEDNFLVRTLQRVYQEQTGEEAKLLAIGGGTYARALDLGVAFGPAFPGDPELAHQRDEYIEVEHLLRLVGIYAHAIEALAGRA